LVFSITDDFTVPIYLLNLYFFNLMKTITKL